MTDYVIDTNVLVLVDQLVNNLSEAELNCIIACRQWLEDFFNGDNRLVVDDQYLILQEYRANIVRGGRAYRLLARLESQPRDRLVSVSIELDDDGYARLPPHLEIQDRN